MANVRRKCVQKVHRKVDGRPPSHGTTSPWMSAGTSKVSPTTWRCRMPSVASKHSNGEGSLRAIQALMCELGADPPGYFDPFPRQPLHWAIVDPDLPPMLRCLEWVRFHTMCYDGVPKNAQGGSAAEPLLRGSGRQAAEPPGLRPRDRAVDQRGEPAVRRPGAPRVHSGQKGWQHLVPRQSRTSRRSRRPADRGGVSARPAESVYRADAAGLASAGHRTRDSGLHAESYTIVSG
jgi:hypothetical protein